MRSRPTFHRPPALTVGELTRRLKGLLEQGFQNVWVEGEMGQVKAHASGHVYFTLKDGEARIDGVVWRTQAWRMRYQPLEGHRVIARGSLSVHAPRGAYCLVVDLFLPAGAGDLQAAFEQLKRQLAGEGLFDRARKRPLPLLPRAVGVVTSPTGAARRDIETVLHRRSPQIPIVLYPALVQGDGAVDDVVRGIARLAADPRVDVIIVGRGGGSLEDLWTFNEERVARAIAACRVPVISAVGHETDTTIADLVADVRAATPSEAAERAVPSRTDLLYTLDGLAERLARAMERRGERAANRLENLRRRLSLDGGFTLHARRVERLADRLDRAVQRRLAAEKATLHRLEGAVRSHHPVARLAAARRRIEQTTARLGALGPARVERDRRRLDGITERLIRAGEALTAAPAHRLGLLGARLDALSPLAGLARGFSITRRDGRVVRRARDLAVGDGIEVLLHRGRLAATVTDVHPDDPEESR